MSAITDQILDAAEQCLMESGLTARLHAAIAERAGVSRPTVYKHVGDQSAIVEALIQREVGRFFAATEPVLTRRGPLRERFIETVVFVVGYARDHALLQKGLAETPEKTLPWFTTKAETFIELSVAFFVPHIRAAMREDEIPGGDPRVLVEWAYRVIASLITTPGTLDLDDPVRLRDYVTALFDIGPTPPLSP